LLDQRVLRGLKPVLDSIARGWVSLGFTANAMTWLAFALGLGSCALVVAGHMGWALALMLASRLADGVDGTVARLTQPTPLGAYLDITLDFLFYASVPLAFALHDPLRNALPAAVLLAAFIGTGSTFLAFAVLAEKHGLAPQRSPGKGFYFLGGLTEGTETIVCFALMMLWSAHFTVLAYVFAALCAITIATRIAAGLKQLGRVQ
jgi:phosphatidylglycerophosphate synthase